MSRLGLEFGVTVSVSDTRLKEIAKQYNVGLDQALETISQKILKKAKELAPLDTGELRASGVVRKDGEKSYQIRFGDGLPDGRAVFQEFGTGNYAFDKSMLKSPEEYLDSETLKSKNRWVPEVHVPIRPKYYLTGALLAYDIMDDIDNYLSNFMRQAKWMTDEYVATDNYEFDFNFDDIGFDFS